MKVTAYLAFHAVVGGTQRAALTSDMRGGTEWHLSGRAGVRCDVPVILIPS